MLSRNLEQSLHRALAFATDRNHEYATLEHLLLALIDDEDAHRQLSDYIARLKEEGRLVAEATPDPDVIRIGVSYLRIDGFILPIYMMLFAINSFLQALKRPIWTFWIGVYRQAFGVAFFVFVYVMLFDGGVLGVWFGIATAVVTGLLISLVVAEFVARDSIGGLLRRETSPESV